MTTCGLWHETPDALDRCDREASWEGTYTGCPHASRFLACHWHKGFLSRGMTCDECGGRLGVVAVEPLR